MCYSSPNLSKGGEVVAENKIQSQKAISLHIFQLEFGILEQCRAQLFQYCWPQGQIL